MTGLFALTQASHGVGANAADTLFFVRFGVEFLPVMILASGPVLMLATLGYTVGLGRLGASSWLALLPAGLAGLTVLEWLAISLRWPGIYVVIWLGAQLAILLSYTAMWNVAGEVSTTRQARRLFPLFASAGMARRHHRQCHYRTSSRALGGREPASGSGWLPRLRRSGDEHRSTPISLAVRATAYDRNPG